MKAMVFCGALTLVILATGGAEAKGCIKGAIVGGAVGHYAGHHGLLGAGAGCIIGHHEANKHARERERERTYRDEGYGSGAPPSDHGYGYGPR